MAISTGQYNLTPPTLSDGTQAPLSLDATGRMLTISGGSGTTSDQVQGNVANGATDAGNPVGIGGFGSGTTPTTVTTGQRVKAWLALNGAIVVSAASRGGSDGISNGLVGFMSSMDGVAGVPLAVAPLVYNGTTLDRASTSTAVGGIVSAAATTNATSVKASSGKIHSITAQNVTAAAKFLKVYNKASAPTVGTDTPIFTLAIPPSPGTLTVSFPNGGHYFATGIAFALTGLAAVADTTALAAGDVVGLNIAYS
jgi:hypothetical protein